MSGYTSYIIVPELKLIITYFEGSMSLEDLIHLNKKFMNDEMFDPSYDMLMDFRNAVAIGFRMDIQDYIDFLRNSVSFPKVIRNGIIYGTPNLKFLVSVFKPLSRLMKLNTMSFPKMEEYFEWMNYEQEEQNMIFSKIQLIRARNHKEISH